MIFGVFVWLVQDILQVLCMGFLLIPELFLLLTLFIVTLAVVQAKDITFYPWYGFVGGLMWDYRWTGFPGISAILNTSAILFVVWAWCRTPPTGRTALLCVLLVGFAHLIVGLAHYATWEIPSATALRLFAIQQLLMLPLIVMFYLFFQWKAQDLHV